MNNYLRKFLLWFIGSFTVLFLLAVALAAIFEDSIGKKIVLELNNHITSKLSVKDVNLSLIRHFPRASVTLEDTKLLDTKGNVLLEADELSFAMSFWSALSDNPNIHMVRIEDGTLNLVFDSKGNGNYDIFKPSKTKGPNDFKLKISTAMFDNLIVNYKNAGTKTDISATLQEGELKGDFSAERYLLDLDTEWLVHYISSNSNAYFKNKPLALVGKFDINTKTQTYAIKECTTDIAENVFNIKGTMKNLKSGLDFDMFATGNNIRIEKLLLLMDGMNQKSLKDIKSKGIVKIDTRVNGVLNSQSNPAITIAYNLTNGSIISSNMSSPFENLSFKGKFSNGWAKNMRTSTFNLENCKGSFNGIPLGLELRVNNLVAPMIDFVLNGKLPIEKIYGLAGKDKVQNGTGFLTINKLTIKGALADMKSRATVQRVTATGDVDFDNASITTNGEVIQVASGKILIRNNNISFNNIQLTGFDTKMALEGSVSNYLPFILNSDQASKLTFKSSITAPFVNIEKVLKAYSAENSSDVTQTKAGSVVTGSSQNIISRLDGRITIDIDKVVNKKLLGRNFAGVILFEDGGMLVSGDIQAMDGDWNLEGRFSFNKGTDLIATLESDKINIKEFFRQSDNFDQSTITDAHLSGRLNSKMLLNLHWNEQGDFDKDNMHAYAAWSIDNGELIRLKLMESLSKFVKIQDLRHIRFVNFKNLIEIEKGKIYLPAMYIQSNALNLTVSGIHGFNNSIDYSLKLNAGEIIMKKFNLFGKNSGAESAKQNGFFNMYYRVTGTIDKFTQKKDRAGVLASFSRSELRKQKILKALLEEFGSIPEFENPNEWLDEGEKPVKIASETPAKTGPSVSMTKDIKNSWTEAKQTLKNPKTATPKSDRKSFKDEADEEEEFLEFK